MPHNSKPNLKNLAAMNRLRRLRAAGVPGILTGHEAWLLSGGISGRQNGDVRNVPAAKIARDVPDCEEFLEDYLTTSIPPVPAA